MLIGGGVYVEVCITPARTALYGSGGRAAMVVAGLGAEVVLHAFQPEELLEDLEANFNPFGISLVVHPSPQRLSFEYLHPLARPRVGPLPAAPPITVPIEGEAVLRFGCLEGDFRVTAASAVYDPQSGVRPEPFNANGSTASRLAMILNASELRRMTGIDDIGIAASHAMGREAISVLVVKDGAAGAYVFDGHRSPQHVPAYPTDAVYKIGSGDVFSATFAHAWMCDGIAAASAAELASLRTAQYVETPVFPLPREPKSKPTARGDAGGRRVLMVSNDRTASGRWVRQEAVRGLQDLGATVVPGMQSPAFSEGPMKETLDPAGFDVILVHIDNVGTARTALDTAVGCGKPVVVFADDPEGLVVADKLGVSGSDDLCSALYRTQWIPL